MKVKCLKTRKTMLSKFTIGKIYDAELSIKLKTPIYFITDDNGNSTEMVLVNMNHHFEIAKKTKTIV